MSDGSPQFRRLLLPIIKARTAINRKGGLFVITGPGTFSAATINALDLRNEANAILVGSPTGMRLTITENTVNSVCPTPAFE